MLLLVLISFFLGSILPLKAQIDTVFWFVAPEVSVGNAVFDKPIVFRITTFDLPATVTVSQPANTSFTPITVTIPANSTQTVNLTTSLDLVENKPANTVLNKGLKIKSTSKINAYYELVSSNCECNPAVFSLKGGNALGQSFIIPSQTNINNSDYFTFTPVPYSSFEIVATSNNTLVTITPSNNIVGHLADIPYSITLNQGQTYSAKATSQLASKHLNGSIVESNKPIAITISDDLLESETFQAIYADLGGDQIVPNNVLGKKHIVIKGDLNSASQERFYVMAIEANTNLTVNGVASTIANVGETISFTATNNAHYIDANKPVSVLQLTGIGEEMGIEIIPPIECTGSQSVAFVRSSDYTLFLNITIPTGAEDAFTFNGSSSIINAASFSTVPNSGGAWKYLRLEVPTSTLDVGNVARIENSEAYFHLGFLNGWDEKGARFGYVSNFSNVNLTTKTDSICSGQPYDLGNGEIVTEPGFYTYSVSNDNACDSTFNIFLIETTTISSFQSQHLCEGNTLNWNGQTISSSGNFSTNFTSSNGICDSIANLQIILADTFYTEQQFTICPGNSIMYYGQTIAAPGFYPTTFTSTYGCDSTFVANVTNEEIYVQESEVISLCFGETLNWYGQTISNAGQYQHIIPTIGCDTLITLQLSFINPVSSNQNLSVCPGGSIVLYGEEITIAGIYTYVLVSSSGCDSIVNYSVAFNGSYIPTFVASTICFGDSLNWYGQSLTTQDFYETIVLGPGCDTLVALDLTVLQPISTFDTLISCPDVFLDINGVSITSSGNYPFSFSASNGCDSISNIYVSFEEVPVLVSNTLALCEGTIFNWFGQSINAQGVYTHTGVVSTGCDSAYTLVVTMLDTSTQIIPFTRCPGEILSFNGIAITENGAYPVYLTNQNGCDSLVIAQVVFEEDYFLTSTQVGICENDTLFYQGLAFANAGNYEVVIENLSGCDTLVALEIVLSSAIFDTINILGCPGDTIDFVDLNITESGIFTQVLTQVSGCDSIVTWDVVFGDFEVALSQENWITCSDQSITLSANTNAPEGFDLNFTWSNDTAECINCYTQTFQFDENAIVEVSINYGNSCISTDQANIEVIDIDQPTKSILPNAFTPNGDNVNDVFSLISSPDITEITVFRVYDRWGEKVHEEMNVMPNALIGFNGRLRNEDLPSDLYAYYIIFESSCQGTIKLEGNILLLK